jgi:YVTN family beta-propeller protein
VITVKDLPRALASAARSGNDRLLRRRGTSLARAVPATVVFIAVACSATASAATQRVPTRDSITIEISALPRGVRGAATLRGPGVTRTLARTTTFRRVPAGTYALRAAAVSTRKDTYYPRVASCPVVNRCPSLATGRARLKAGGHLKLYVIYEDMVPNTTKVLTGGSLRRLEGGLASDGQLIFRGIASLPLSSGSVIVAASSAPLPYGLLRKVSRVTRKRDETIVVTTPATLIEAVPRGAFDITTPSTSAADVSRTGAHAAGAPATNFSLSLSPIACGGSSGGSVTAHDTVPSSDLSFSASWGSGSPTVSITGTFTEAASASLTWDQGVSCSWSADFPDSPNPGAVGPTVTVPIGDVPVSVTPELVGTMSGSWGVTGKASLSVSASASVTAGITYANGFLHPIFSVSKSFQPSVTYPGDSGQAQFAVGAKLYFDIDKLRLFACKIARNCDLAPTPYLALTENPTLTIQQSTDPWWRLDGGLHLAVGFHLPRLLGLDVSDDFPLTSLPLLAPPGKPTAVTATPGDGTAQISWKAPAANPATPPQDPCKCLPVSGYTVYLNGNAAATTSGATSTTLSDLTNGVSYQVTVASDSSAGFPFNSLRTAPVTVTPMASASAVVKTIPVGSEPYGVSSDGTHVWVANFLSDTVSEIDASTGTVVNTIPVGTEPYGVSSDGTHVWVTNLGDGKDGTVSEIDASTGTVVNTIPVGGEPFGVSSDGTHVWVTDSASSDGVSELDASTGTVVKTITVGTEPYGVSSDGTHVWVPNAQVATVSEIDASTGTVVNTIPVGTEPSWVSSDGTHVWVTNYDGGTVSELDASTGTVVNTITVGGYPLGVSSDGTHVWVTNFRNYTSSSGFTNGDTVSEIDASTGTVGNTITVGSGPAGVSSDGTHVWVSNYYGGTVSEIQIAPSTLLQGSSRSSTAADGAGYGGQLTVTDATPPPS